MTVTIGPPVDILHELEQLGRAPATEVNHLQNAPAFLDFVELCQTRYPQIRLAPSCDFACLGIAAARPGLFVGGQERPVISLG